MKKLIAALILVVVAVVFTAPYFTGKVAEIETLKLVDYMNETAFKNGETQVIEYNRGFRQTIARYKYTPPSWINKDSEGIAYVCQSQHKLTGIEYQCKLEEDSTYKEFVEPLSLTGTVSIFGDITQKIAFTGLNDVDFDGELIDLPKAFFALTTDASLSFYKVKARSEPFAHTNNEGVQVAFDGLSIDANLSQIARLLFTGEMSIALGDMTVVKDSEEVSIKGLSISTNTSAQKDNLDTEFSLAIDQITLPETPYDSTESIDFSFAIKGLDKQAMVDYVEIGSEMQDSLFMALSSDEEPSIANMLSLYSRLIPAMEKMLKENLELSIDASGTLNNKVNKANFNFTLLESLTFAQLPMLALDPQSTVEKFEANFSALINQVLIDNNPEMAELIEQIPFIKVGDDNYKLDLKFNQDIQLNNKIISVDELKATFEK